MKRYLFSSLLLCASISTYATVTCQQEAKDFNSYLNGALPISLNVVKCQNATQNGNSRPLRCIGTCYVKFSGRQFATLANCNWSNDIQTNSKIAAHTVQCSSINPEF